MADIVDKLRKPVEEWSDQTNGKKQDSDAIMDVSRVKGEIKDVLLAMVGVFLSSATLL